MSWFIAEKQLASHKPESLASIFAVGNGRSCTLGSLSEQRRPLRGGVYLSGLFVDAAAGLPYLMQGVNWLPAYIRCDGLPVEAAVSHSTLDMRRGVLFRKAAFECPAGRFTLVEERFASLSRPNLVCQRWQVTVEHATAAVDFVLGLDGDVYSERAKYFQDKTYPNVQGTRVKLTEIESLRADADSLAVVLASPSGRRSVAVARVRQSECGGVKISHETADGMTLKVFRFDPAGCASRVFEFEKLVVLTGDLPGREDAVLDARRRFDEFAEIGWDRALREHAEAMEKFWRVADVEIDGDDVSQQAIRFALWSTRIAAPDDGGRSSIGARNLAGDMYRGGVFWDMDMFQLPLLAAVAPELAKNHVLYRTTRLDAARATAAKEGFAGARYPWTSYSSGLVEDGNPSDQMTHELHVNLAVAWGIRHYWRLSGDADFMLAGGMQTMLEIARFWASRVDGPDAGGRYHIRKVGGPDEFHLCVDDNAYTNILTRRLLRDIPELLAELEGVNSSACARLGVTEAELARWKAVADGLFVPTISEKGGVIEQFAGFHADTPEPNTVINKGRWGRIDKTSKQADVLMIAQAHGDELDESMLHKCWREYAPLCMHYSSLSYCTHALAASRLGLKRDAEKFFRLAEGIDLGQGANDGIHGAGEGGYWMCVVHGFGGLHADTRCVAIEPSLPPEWNSLRYRFLLRGQIVEVFVRPDSFLVANRGRQDIELLIDGQNVEISPGESRQGKCNPRRREQTLQAVVFSADVLTDDSAAPVAKKLLESIRKAKLRLAVVCVRPGSRESLRRSGLESSFDAIVDESNSQKRPPHEEMYVLAAQRMRVLAWNCAGVDAGMAGIQAIRSAGMTAVGVGNVGADASVPSLAEMSADFLQKTLLEME